MSGFTINRVVLIGRLTKDPELRSLPSGTSVGGLRIACNSARRDAGGEYHDKPNYFDVSVFGAAAENVNRYTRKGSRIAIDGRLEWREWETTDQQKRQAVSVVANTVVFLDSPGGRGDGQRDDGGLGDEIDQEIDQRPAGELVAVGEDDELAGVGASAQDDELVF